MFTIKDKVQNSDSGDITTLLTKDSNTSKIQFRLTYHDGLPVHSLPLELSKVDKVTSIFLCFKEYLKETQIAEAEGKSDGMVTFTYPSSVFDNCNTQFLLVKIFSGHQDLFQKTLLDTIRIEVPKYKLGMIYTKALVTKAYECDPNAVNPHHMIHSEHIPIPYNDNFKKDIAKAGWDEVLTYVEFQAVHGYDWAWDSISKKLGLSSKRSSLTSQKVHESFPLPKEVLKHNTKNLLKVIMHFLDPRGFLIQNPKNKDEVTLKRDYSSYDKKETKQEMPNFEIKAEYIRDKESKEKLDLDILSITLDFSKKNKKCDPLTYTPLDNGFEDAISAVLNVVGLDGELNTHLLTHFFYERYALVLLKHFHKIGLKKHVNPLLQGIFKVNDFVEPVLLKGDLELGDLSNKGKEQILKDGLASLNENFVPTGPRFKNDTFGELKQTLYNLSKTIFDNVFEVEAKSIDEYFYEIEHCLNDYENNLPKFKPYQGVSDFSQWDLTSEIDMGKERVKLSDLRIQMTSKEKESKNIEDIKKLTEEYRAVALSRMKKILIHFFYLACYHHVIHTFQENLFDGEFFKAAPEGQYNPGTKGEKPHLNKDGLDKIDPMNLLTQTTVIKILVDLNNYLEECTLTTNPYISQEMKTGIRKFADILIKLGFDPEKVASCIRW